MPSPRYRAAGTSDVGKNRKLNEDRILVCDELGLYLVSDGMGGHNAGEVASSLAVASIKNFFEATSLETYIAEERDTEGDERVMLAGAKRLAASIHKANGDVFEISSTYTQHRGMGCTIVALYVPVGGDVVHIAHAGDSRCYRVREGQIEQLTRDHSLISDLLAIKPDLSEKQLLNLPKNIVTKALGIEATVSFDVRTEELLPGDVYLLCSDGLSGMVSDKEILGTFEVSEKPQEVSDLLVAMANEAGGVDNVSVVLVKADR